MNNEQIAVFAGGCFWCTEPVFTQLKGVSKVVSGYIGGHTINPTYKDICNGDTGHAEAIEIHYNAAEISYGQLLEVFLVAHDPTTPNRQGNDIGTQYRSAVFYLDDAQRDSARQIIQEFDERHIYNAPIVTEVVPATTFYPAEDYHQYYFAKNPSQPYCLAVAAPKAAKIRQKYAQLIKE
jgi:peptide-methionine (S)-S-oxide reductase